MRVFIFSDIHGDLRALNRIVEQPADLYIAAGDLATFGKGLDRCGEVLRPLDEPAEPKDAFGVAGEQRITQAPTCLSTRLPVRN